MNKWLFPFFVPQSSAYQNKTAPVVGALLWLIMLLVVGIGILQHPQNSTVTGYYHNASANWLARAPLYEGGHMAMNYLPHFAIIFSMFHFLPQPWGDILWRFCSVALLATGLLRWVRQLFGEPSLRIFAWASAAIIPLSAAAVRNGQANVILGGLMLHAAASISARQWWFAAAFIWLAVIAKPVALVLVLLAPFVYRKLWVPLLVTLVIMAVFPFLFAKAPYVVEQYRAFAGNLRDCASVQEHDYADLTGILYPLGVQLSPFVSQCIRVFAGLVVLVLWLLGSRRLDGPARALWLFTLAAGYLMVFNPMNESNSYVVLAPAFAIWAAFFLDRSSSDWRGWLFAFMLLSMGFLPNIVRPWFGNKFALCYHPSMTLLFIAVLVFSLCVQTAGAPLEPALADAK